MRLRSYRLLGLTPITQLINGLPCQAYRPFLGENTDYLCSKVPHLHQILYQSNLESRERCRYDFRDHPWGCQLSSKLVPLRRFLRQGERYLSNFLLINNLSLKIASKEASFYTTLTSATLTLNLINACIRGQINDTDCLCSKPGQLCQIDPKIAFQLSRLITDGMNMTKTFQQKSLFQLNQANKELGRKVNDLFLV